MEKLLNEIHRRFRLAMNGVVSSSMRAKGMPYKVNFGVSLPQLKQIAALYRPDAELAKRLWSENIRESRLLATFLQPREDFSEEEALRWMRQADTPELADFLCMNLLRYQPYASALALKTIVGEDGYVKRTGYALVGRLFSEQQPFVGGDLDTYIRTVEVDLSLCDNGQLSYILLSLRYAVRNQDMLSAVLAAFAPDTAIGGELRLEYDYYRQSFSDM